MSASQGNLAVGQKVHFGTLDAMRGVAAICVMLFHYRRVLSGEGAALPYIFPSGYLAVDRFFLLSGFVVSYAYDRRFAEGMSTKDFLVIRAIRLMPMIWLGVAVGSVAILISGRWDVIEHARHTLLNLLLIPSATEPDAVFYPTNTPEWSIFFEMIANVAFVLFFIGRRLRWLACVIGFGALALSIFAPIYGQLKEGETYETFHIGLARVTFSFFLGVLLCRTRHIWQVRVPKVPSWVLLVVLALLLLVGPSAGLRPYFDLAFILVISPIIVMLGASNEPPPHGLATAQRLAMLSYPLYALNQPFRLLLKQVAHHTSVPEPLVAAITALILVPISLLVARYYDEPVRAFLTRHTTKRAQAVRPTNDRAL